MKIILATLAVIGGMAGGYYYWQQSNTDNASVSVYRTATVSWQDISVKIAASGTIEPEEIVDVGAQVAGKIIAFGNESNTGNAINYGSHVEPGAVLARIDDALFQAEVLQARAAHAQAEYQQRSAESGVMQATADLRRTEADLARLRANLQQADQNWRRLERIVRTKAATDQEYEIAETALNVAKANLSVGEAAVEQGKVVVQSAQIAIGEAQAKVAGALAALQKSEKNLEYTTIRSPIRGVIVDRRVNIGQTVVSNLNAPSLFLIAKDLSRLEVWASVNEADIGTLREQLPVEFTVDAFPGEVFRGVVKQVRLNATMTQSVVTYTVVVAVDNESGKLLPYLTANVRFIVAEKAQTLSVPTAAIRWKPKPEQVIPSRREEFSAQASGKGAKRRISSGSNKNPSRGTVSISDDGFVRPVEVEIGLSDSNHVEIVAGDLAEGTEVIVGESPAVRKQTKNPFAPSLTQGLDR